MTEHLLSEEKALAIIIASHNDKRRNLLEKSEAFSRIYDLYGSIKKVSQITGIDETSVRRYLIIGKLPDEVKAIIDSGRITSYHVAAELLSISNKDRLIETSIKIQGLPREIAREAIRYVKKNKDVGVNDCIDKLLEFYQKDITIKVYIFKGSELFKNNNVELNILINNLQELFITKYSTKLRITNVSDSEDYSFMIEKNEYSNHDIKNFKQLIIKHIKEMNQ